MHEPKWDTTRMEQVRGSQLSHQPIDAALLVIRPATVPHIGLKSVDQSIRTVSEGQLSPPGADETTARQ